MKVAILFTVCALAAAADPAPWEADVKTLLEGAPAIAAPGAPGTLAVWGSGAFPVVIDANRAPVVAAARMGRGRIVAFAHDGYGGAKALGDAGTAALFVNAIKWCGGPSLKSVGVVGGDAAEFLAGKGFEVTKVDPTKLPTALRSLDVVCVFDCDLGVGAVDALDRFLSDGRGVVAGVTGWGWSQVHGGADVRGNPLNRLVAPAGLAWTADFATKTSVDGFTSAEVPAEMCHAGRAMKALEDGAPAADLARAFPAALAAVRVLPDIERDLRAHLDRLAKERGDRLIASAEAPLKDPLDRFLLVAQIEEARRHAVGERPAVPAAAGFPGAVPKDARPVERDIAVDASVPDWHSTGLYASPGEPVTVEFPEAAVGNLKLRIGCHTDSIRHFEAWPRAPEVSEEFAAAAAKTTVSSPLGGLLYLVIPAGSKLGKFSIHVSGAVEAPYFLLGKTTLESWKRLREAPAPWAELASSKVILSVPSSVIRNLDDPKSLMEFWDRVLDGAADLAGIPKDRARPERYVADAEISAGYMHSGYPIMTHLDAAGRMASLEAMQKGDWGLFHELGHNHQQPDWTFEGTGEVTNNLWSLYLSETLCNLTPEQAHEALKDRDKKARAFVKGGAPFEKWKSDPFLALMMYVQLKEAFGWEPFKVAFLDYRNAPQAERPVTDQQKRDQWLTRMSRACKKDLSQFFETWGIPVSKEAKDSLKGFVKWMPADFPGR